jgi:hypothetical protein
MFDAICLKEERLGIISGPLPIYLAKAAEIAIVRNLQAASYRRVSSTTF